jgi:iron(III) transport system substrate-binding protein
MTRGALRAALAAMLAVGALGNVRAAPPTPVATDQALIDAATKEATLKWYTSAELAVVETIGKAFEKKYPGITVSIERSGAERNFQRIEQEYASGIHAADVVDSSDATHFLAWKQAGLLAPFVPAEVPDTVPPDYRDPDGTYTAWRATLSIMGYNTKLVQEAQAPKRFADLLDPAWTGKLVKAHPGYSGTIMTATYEIWQRMGWDFFARLGKQRVMQVQSANDPPRKLEAGERAVMVDGVEYLLLLEQAKGAPLAPIYPAEGTPFIVGSVGVMKDAPHPNAARLYEAYLASREAQQLIVDVGALRSLHPQVKERSGRAALKDIPLLKDDPQGTASHADEIKKKYQEYFGI